MDAHPLPLTRTANWLRLAAAMATILVLLVAAPYAQSTPATGTAHRIISLVPAVTEMLFAIGAGADVAGVSSYDTFPEEATTKPKVGALLDPDFERILSLKPDLVVVYGTQTELIARLTRVSIPMFHYEHAGLPDVTATIRAIGDRVGHAAAGRTLADRIEADLASVRARVSGRPKPRTLLVFGRESGGLRGIYASGGIGFLHDMLETAGGTDVFADIKRQSVQVTTEMLLARAPEVILELHGSTDVPKDRLAAERDSWRILPALPAVRANRVYLLTDDALMIPGPRVAGAVKQMADVLHPQK
jgi:iron complex transport system substrate-binding protein